jgi:hypothetical protein
MMPQAAMTKNSFYRHGGRMLLRSWLTRFRSKLIDRRGRRKPQQAMLERLETRSLMSVTPAAVTFTATEGTAFSGTVATFTTNDHSPSAGNYSATVDWGDGNKTSGSVVADSGHFDVVGGHTYFDNDGTSNVKVTINDSVDNSHKSTFSQANVAEVPLTLTAQAIETTEGVTFTGKLATFSDPGTSGDPTEYVASINWGDGTVSTGTLSYTSGANFDLSGRHTYSDEGNYTATVSVREWDSPSTKVASTLQVTVDDADNFATTGMTITPSEGRAFSGVVSVVLPTNSAADPGDFTASIDWGDGQTTAGSISAAPGHRWNISGSHNYAEEGTYSVETVIAEDNPNGASFTVTTTAIVSDTDSLATIAASVSATEGTTYSGPVAIFTNAGYPGNPATDFTATIDWGDGTTTAGTVSGSAGTLTVSGSHGYSDEGSYPLTVTLGDDAPGTATATATGTASVADADVLVPAAASVSATEGTTFSGQVATFTNTGYAANAATDFTAMIDWGDGTTTAGTVSGSAGTYTVSGSHLYADEGSCPLAVTLSDDAPGTAVATAAGTAIVADADVLAPIAASVSATEGTTFSGPVATFTNAGYSGNPATDFTAMIDWGDGTATAGTVSGSAGTLTVSGSHLYADEGSNPVTVTLNDDAKGAATATATGTASVTDADSLAPVSASVSATEGTTFSGAVATFTNAGYAANPATDFTATIDWGDGTTTAGTVSGSAGTLTVSGSHQYADEGSNPLTVTLSDDAPGTATAIATGTATIADADTVTPQVVTTGTVTENELVGGMSAIFQDAGYASNDPADFTGTFDWGDGTTFTTGAGNVSITSDGSGNFTLAVAGHAYADEGVYTVVATLSDDSPGTATSSQTGTLTVTEADSLTPSATPATLTGTEGTAVSGNVATFSNAGYASNSAADFTATIDWGDGTTTAGTVSGGSGADLTVSGSHAYADEGSYPVTVTLADDAPGTATATATTTAIVAEGDFGNLTPITIAPTEGQAFSGAVANFTDPGNPLQTAGDFSATIDWGDGITTAGTVSGTTGGPFTISGSHTYADEGTFTVLASFADDSPSSLTATVTSTAAVSEADVLSGTAGPIAATEGAVFTGTALAVFTDTGYSGNVPGDFSATIDWGDGTTDTGTVSGGAGTFTVSGDHTYADEGSFPVTIALADDAPGTASATVTTTATVADSDTLVPVAATVNATEGTTYSGAVATFTNSGYAGNPAADFIATIDWGDGTTTAGTVSGSAGTLTVSGSHLYAEEGSNPLSVTLSDDAPGTAAATATGTANVAEGDALAPIAASVSATEGTTFSGMVATFTNAGYAGNAATDFVATIDWGDGTTTAGTVTGSAGTLTVSGSHLYADEGSNPLTVTLSDDAPGTAIATATGTASVADADLLAPVTASVSATEGTTFSGAVATFTNSGYAGNPATDFTATIDWGDGTTTAGTVSGSGGTLTVSGSHLYADEGSNPLTVTLSDDAPGAATATATGTASVADADDLDGTGMTLAATEGTAFTGAVATFTNTGYAGNPATDFNATIDWGDGTTTAGTVSGSAGTLTVSGSHTYLDEGTYAPLVTLSDLVAGSASATAQTPMTVADADSLKGSGMTLAASEGNTYSGVVGGFASSYTDSSAADFSATIDWGDGTTSSGTVSGAAGAFTVSGSHLYADEGNFVTSIAVSENKPGTATTTLTGAALVAESDSFSVSALPVIATQGTPFSGQVAIFTDATYPNSPIDNLTATINWGDGTSSAGTITSLGGGNFAVSGTHTWLSPQATQIAVTVSDASPGTATGTSQASLSIASLTAQSASPIVGANVTLSGYEQTPLDNATVATFTHTGSDPASNFTATINWGDGTTTAGTVALSGGVYTVTGSHNYTDEGTFAVNVSVDDVPDSVSATINSSATMLEELLPGGVRGTANERFVSELYRDILGRAVDASSLGFWSAELDAGTSRTTVAAQIVAAADAGELSHQIIENAFQTYLHRAADAAALTYFGGLLATGTSVEQLTADILSSNEYFAVRGGGADAGFLNAVYQDLLGRPIDPGAQTTLVQFMLLGGSRQQVVSLVMQSAEYDGLFVEQSFTTYLHRPADSGAITVFSAQLAAGASQDQVLSEILGSNEYFAQVSS